MSKKTGKATEEERAEEHYLHRDDEDRWGDPVPSQAPVQLSVMVSARFSRSEADQLRAAAQAAGMTRSAFVRQAALTAAQGQVIDVQRVRREVTAAERRLAAARRALG